MKIRTLLLAALATLAIAATGCKKDNGGKRALVASYNAHWEIAYERQSVMVSGTPTVQEVFTLTSSDRKSYIFGIVPRATSVEYSDRLADLCKKIVSEIGTDDVMQGDAEVVYEPLEAGEYVAYMVGVSKGKATGEFSRLNFTAGTSGGGEESVTYTINPAWSVSYAGRETETDVDGTYVTETFNCTVGASDRYLLTAIDRSVFSKYYPTVQEYLQEEVDYLASQLEYFSGYGATIDDFTYVGSGKNALDKLRHGNYSVYLIGVDNNGKATGDYAVNSFYIAEATPTDAFKKWLGSWSIGDASVKFNITIASAEANEAYAVTGWEAGSTMETDFSDYSFETVYNEDGSMSFVSQWLNTEEDESGSYEVGFYGMLGNGGGPMLEDDEVMAIATLAGDGNSASLAKQSFEYYTDETYTTTAMYPMETMQYLGYDDDFYYNFGNKVPSFPMTMTRISSAGGASARPALRSYSSAGRHQVIGGKVVRPLRHKAAHKGAVRRMREASPLKLNLRKK